MICVTSELYDLTHNLLSIPLCDFLSVLTVSCLSCGRFYLLSPCSCRQD